MEIATVTHHSSFNYGGVLQSYALVKYLQQCGHNAYVLDYWPDRRVTTEKSIYETHNCYNPKIMAINLAKYFLRNKLLERRKRFNDFRKNILSTSPKRYLSSAEIEESPPNADLYIAGSDQIWNPIDSLDEVFYLQFTKRIAKKSAAYAPSIGIPEIPAEFKSIMSDWINNIDYLSSREHRGSQIIKELTGRSAPTVVDPVLLLQKNEWKSLIGERLHHGEYILVYSVRRRKYLEEVVRKIKDRYKLPVIMIAGENPLTRGLIPADHVHWDAGPIDFINLFANAKCVCTDSFHGTAFSVLFEKPFINISHTRGDSRAQSLLIRAGVEDRRI